MFRPSPDAPFPPALPRPAGQEARTMLIAQITDVHLGYVPGDPDEPNRRRLDQALATIARLDRRPDLLFVTGDLVEHGDAASYRALRGALAATGLPVHLCLGNHDARAAFRLVYPEVPVDDAGFVQYVVETPGLRCIVLDTLEEGRHGGGFCATRAAWLRARLAEAPERPTLIVLPHPPFDCGIEWITTDPDEPWVARLRGAIGGGCNIVGMIAGHIHRPIVTGWAGAPFVICPSTAPQLALTLAAVDPDVPDRRPMVVAGAPGLALHWWNGAQLVSHFADAADTPVIARFDGHMQPAVRAMMAERPA